MDGLPLPNDRGEAPADGHAGRGTSGAYRPRYQVVAERILQLIGDQVLRPGDRMPTEKELATRLGTSRTVVRDAIKILSATGQVSAQKGRGLYVADGESMLGTTPVGRLLRAHQPRPHIHALRIQARPGDAGQPARREASQPV